MALRYCIDVPRSLSDELDVLIFRLPRFSPRFICNAFDRVKKNDSDERNRGSTSRGGGAAGRGGGLSQKSIQELCVVADVVCTRCTAIPDIRHISCINRFR